MPKRKHKLENRQMFLYEHNPNCTWKITKGHMTHDSVGREIVPRVGIVIEKYTLTNERIFSIFVPHTIFERIQSYWEEECLKEKDN